jgi:hypothetical protein
MRPGQGTLWKLVIVLAPYLLAFWVAGSRTRDYRHNFDDVSVGAAIGIVAAVLSYHINFPPLHDENCRKPILFHRSSNSEPRAIPPRFDMEGDSITPPITTQLDNVYYVPAAVAATPTPINSPQTSTGIDKDPAFHV